MPSAWKATMNHRNRALGVRLMKMRAARCLIDPGP
jgi:hypothetical protein